MQKILLIWAFTALITFPMQANTANITMEMGVAELIDESAPIITVNQNAVTVEGASGMTLEVVSLTGKAVASVKIESSMQRIELNLPKGCYILKVGKTVRKVTLH